MKNGFLFFLAMLGTTALFAQGKKTSIYELDKHNGLFFQKNTIDPFSGIAFDKFPDGKKKIEIHFKNGKMSGSSKRWAPNGKKVFESTYLAGVQNGTEYQWFPSGRKKLEINYNNGIPNGVCIEWHKGGGRKSEGLFENGKEQGEHKWWYSTGGIDQIIFFSDGKANGSAKNWYESGKLWMEKSFENGLQTGEHLEFYMNGGKKVKGNFIAGKEDGEFLFWSKKELLEAKQVFEKGNLVQDYDYRSGSINISSGYIEVFNEAESFFCVKISSQQVSRKRGKIITYVVDGKLLQFFKTPIAKFYEGTIDQNTNGEILKKYEEYESSFISASNETVIDIKTESGTTKEKLDYLHWNFISPSSKDQDQTPKSVQKEHYFSFVCGKEILSLYSVVTKADKNSKSIVKMLKHIADGLRISEDRIDLNQVNQKIYGGN